jgi:2-hydroxychromene-2-carboxylate isomerase
MAQSFAKSRTFAVVISSPDASGSRLQPEQVHFLYRLTSGGLSQLLHKATDIRNWHLLDEAELVEFLKNAGLTVRHFNKGESQWQDTSTQLGIVRAPGNRDGSWGVPTLLEFERDYLPTI